MDEHAPPRREPYDDREARDLLIEGLPTGARYRAAREAAARALIERFLALCREYGLSGGWEVHADGPPGWYLADPEHPLEQLAMRLDLDGEILLEWRDPGVPPGRTRAVGRLYYDAARSAWAGARREGGQRAPALAALAEIAVEQLQARRALRELRQQAWAW